MNPFWKSDFLSQISLAFAFLSLTFRFEKSQAKKKAFLALHLNLINGFRRAELKRSYEVISHVNQLKLKKTIEELEQ